MVSNPPSLVLRLSGDSAEDSGVVPHDESRAPCDIDDVGDPVTDVDELFWKVETAACPFTPFCLAVPRAGLALLVA